MWRAPPLRRLQPARSAALGAILAIGALTMCVSDRQATGPVPVEGDCRIPLTSPILGASHTLVAIRNFGFHPATVRVKEGTTVTWVNCEPETIDPHTSTSETGVWASTSLPPGAIFSHTFDQAGSFPYFCVPHPFMRATVIVEP